MTNCSILFTLPCHAGQKDLPSERPCWPCCWLFYLPQLIYARNGEEDAKRKSSDLFVAKWKNLSIRK